MASDDWTAAFAGARDATAAPHFLAFTPEDVERANINCGPAALCACLGMTPDQILPHIDGFKARGYMDPRMMSDALASAGFCWRHVRGDGLPDHGLVRVFWRGPWSAPGVHPGAAAARSHWIAAKDFFGETWIYDVNSNGWEPRDTWESYTATRIAASIKRCDGTWVFDQRWEVRKRR
jgi:hypothetical protein